jgi:glycosyltransferase involved in cell wall biosynthesis
MTRGKTNCSVVIRTLNEADRLRLTLTSLACQSGLAEVVVTDDGSTDHTTRVLDEFRGALPLVSIRHSSPKGRSAASSAAAAMATGDLLLFLDGDTLAHPALVERHLAAHAERPDLIGRGETFHLRCTRFLQDPETASPRPGEAARLAAMRPAEREKLKVSRRQIEADFAAIEVRAGPGIYPGAGPRALHELELDALRNHPDCDLLWAAACGANLSIRRDAFAACGGFDEAIDNNEHRELCLRLCAAGGRMGLVEGARSFHLTHRTGWRDPLIEADWETVFYRRHPLPAVKLLAVLWASIADNSPIPPEARILSLPDLARRSRDAGGVDYDDLREAILGLPRLVAA